MPAIRYAEGLPVTERRDEIARAIRDHQVVIVAGETGSGKTTQLPKVCLELGRGVAGTIGHTQPRRIAARNVAERIAEELDTPLGQAVGYTVRFTDRVSESTLVRVMTDGILLAEVQRDRRLRRYDTLIIDEAHERSLNIDFLLGYLKALLPERPDLKVIITSATIDTARFSAHFDDAPIVEVSGRSYPVDIRYRPLGAESTDDRDQTQGILDAVDELSEEGPGDILVFLSGEREIRDVADALEKAQPDDRRSQVEVLPLYARLSAAEQQRVFQPHPGRRVVLATNVAETSLTVPGIRYVIDPGTARISRYNRRTKVQRLPIEAISQASANQRAGRCGRVAPGICIRLYDEDDFASRPEFTDPEILRTNLASVILQMAAIGLGDVAGFPFVDPPDHRAIADGLALLHELGALRQDPTGRGAQADGRAQLTPVGRQLAQLPVDPRLGRMVLEAETQGALREVTIIAAALSIQDPRERPTDKARAAAESHARFADRHSDFVSYLNLWAYLAGLQKELSGNQFRKRCRAEFLNYLRVREWQDIAAQIRHVLRAQGVRASRRAATPDAVHRSLLAGLLSQIGVREGDSRDYLGARNARFAIAPGSNLSRAQPRWVMAGALVETNRLWARTVARIAPEWVERAGDHVVKRSYSEPRWDARRGAAMALERVTLYGVPVVTGRQVPYSQVDRAAAHDIFLHQGLVDGEWETHHPFPAANRKVLDEARARRRSNAVDELSLFDFYDDRIPIGVTSGRDFDTWWKKVRLGDPDLLTVTPDMLAGPDAAALDPTMFPDRWHQGDLSLAVSYEWQPGADDDGVTVSVPLAVLDRVNPTDFDWQVPGLRAELVVGLIRSLPKVLRRHFVPAPNVAAAFLDGNGPEDGNLAAALAAWLRRQSGEAVSPASFSRARVPEHLQVRFEVVDDQRRRLASGRDLDAVRRVVDAHLQRAVVSASRSFTRSGAVTWEFGDLPATVTHQWGGRDVLGYPALVDEGSSVGLRVFGTPVEADASMWEGTWRLLLLAVPPPTGRLQRALADASKLALLHAPTGRGRDLVDDAVGAATDVLLARHGGPVRTAASFEALRAAVAAELGDEAEAIVRLAGAVLAALAEAEARLSRLDLLPALSPSLADIARQLAALVHPGFVTECGPARLPDLVRYLRAVERRADTLGADPGRDQRRMLAVLRLQRAWRALPPSPAATEIRWMIEELRVSLWAQSLGTPIPISEERIRRALGLAHA